MPIEFDRVFAQEARKGSGDLMSTLLRAHNQAPETSEAYDIGYGDGARLDAPDERTAEDRLVEELGGYSAVRTYLGIRGRMFNFDGGITDEAHFALADYKKGFTKAVSDRENREAKGE